MFSIFKEYHQNNNTDDLKIPLSKEAEDKLLNLTKSQYNHLLEKYPFNKSLNNEEFYQLSRGILISLLATCTDESYILDIVDCYHMYIIKMYFIFCVARGFHINKSFCEYLDDICNNFFQNPKISDYWTEFNNNYDDMPLWDALMKETDFCNKIKQQELKNFDKLTLINDIKEIDEDSEHLFEFFISAIKYFNFDDEQINPLYLKYINLCEKHYLPLPNLDEKENENKKQKKSAYNQINGEIDGEIDE
jgi:hypothetical protein